MTTTPNRVAARAVAIDLIVLLAVAIVLGLAGGKPYFHPDQVLDEAVKVLTNHGNPEYFHYPGLVIYAQAALYGLLYLVSRAAGGPASLGAFLERLDARFTDNLPGQVLTVVFGFLGIAAAYFTVRTLTRRRALSILAGLFVATSLLWVVNLHYVTVDVPFAALCVLTVLLAVLSCQSGEMGLGRAALIGAAVGLSTAAKYNGALVAVSAVVPMLVLPRAHPRRWAGYLVVSGIAAVLVFAVTNPFIFLDWPTFVDHFTSRATELEEGRLGFFMSNGWTFHLLHSLRHGYGLIPLSLAALGVAWLARSRSVTLPAKVALVLFPIVFFLVMGRSKAAFPRHILPLVPFLGIYSALGLLAVSERLPSTLGRLVPLIGLAALLPGAAWSVRHDVLLGRGDTRQALEKVLKGVGTDYDEITLYAGRYTRMSVERSGVDPGRFLTSSYRFRDKNDPVYHVLSSKADIIIFDSFSHDRLLGDGPSDAGPADLEMMTISPYRAPKQEVPFSPDSTYSPFMPDLPFRLEAGPFIEIYFRRELGDALRSACARAEMEFKIEPAGEGFYFRNLPAAYR